MFVHTQNKEDCGEKLVSAGVFQKACNIHASTLRNWRLKGLIRYVALPTGRFRYPLSEVDRLTKKEAPAPEDS